MSSACTLIRQTFLVLLEYCYFSKLVLQYQYQGFSIVLQYKTARLFHPCMVGVVLKSTWVQARKANGEVVQARVSNTVNAWKSGKFMDLTSRPWSLELICLK